MGAGVSTLTAISPVILIGTGVVAASVATGGVARVTDTVAEGKKSRAEASGTGAMEDLSYALTTPQLCCARYSIRFNQR